MTDALVGWSGFVGGTLLRQHVFSDRFRSTDIDRIRGAEFDTVYCAGAPAQKWIANQAPDRDRSQLGTLISALAEVHCRRLVLISTVDVFGDPAGVDEDSVASDEGLHAYGRHRRQLEKFVEDRFPNHLIVRLPGLVGPGLRKNVIFDLHNKNRLDLVDSRNVFQFYPMVNLAYDIDVALHAGLRLVHLTAAPISVADVAMHCFGHSFYQHLDIQPARYDFRTRHASLFGGIREYQYDERATKQAIRAYAQSEPHASIKGAP
mgnify:CR=1 FL=1